MLAFALAAVVPGAPALAAKDPPIAAWSTVEEKNLLAGKAAIQPTEGYIFLRSMGRFTGAFLRVPDEQDRADYGVVFENAFAKAEKSYAVRMKYWDAEVKFAHQRRLTPPPKPVEPKRETFPAGDIALRLHVQVGPMFLFSKSSDTEEVSYLNSVKPGTYIYYGPVFTWAYGVGGGTCYCMGSVRFEVKAGQITDLGNFLSVAADAASQPTPDLPPKVIPAAAATPTYGLPPSLASYPSARAEFHASGKVNNIYGITVSRMPPVPGVLAYRRDIAVDVATGQDAGLGLGAKPVVAALP